MEILNREDLKRMDDLGKTALEDGKLMELVLNGATLMSVNKDTLRGIIRMLIKKTTRGEELFKLMQENPELPVVPMVDSDVVPDDDCARWTGSWGSASIDEYFTHDGRIFFRSDEDIDDVLSYALNGEEYDETTDEEAEAVYDALPWIKAIIVNIDTP